MLIRPMLLPPARHIAALLALVMLLAACGGGDDTDPVPPGGGPPAATSEAVAFQIDAGHSGIANEPTPTFPLSPAWQRTFAGAVS